MIKTECISKSHLSKMHRIKSQTQPIKICASCGNKFAKGVQCSACERFYDLPCANISEIGYRRLEFEGKGQWKCIECRPLSPKSPRSLLKPEQSQKVMNKPASPSSSHSTNLQSSEMLPAIIPLPSICPKSLLRPEQWQKAMNKPDSPASSHCINSTKVQTSEMLPPIIPLPSICPKSLLRPEQSQKVMNELDSSSSIHLFNNTNIQSSEMLPAIIPLSTFPKSLVRPENDHKFLKNTELYSSHRIKNSNNISSSEITLGGIMNKLDSISSLLEPLASITNDVIDIKTGFEKQDWNDSMSHSFWNWAKNHDIVQCESCVQMQVNSNILSIYGGIPPLVRLVSHENPEVCRNACGALRNLSYGRQNDENKRAIRDAGGIPALMALLCRATDMEVKELVTGVIWNMSSCEDLKQSIIDDAAQVIVNKVLIPHSGWHPTNPGDTYWSTVFRNSSGVLRNASSAGEYARRRLRSLPGLAEALLHAVRAAVQANAIGTKIVENCVCVLRNLSYRCQEIEDPLYDTRAPPTQSSGQARIQASASKGENLGCFGGSKKKKEGSTSSNSTSPLGKSEQEAPPPEAGAAQLGYSVPKGTEMLWSPEVVPLYMALLQTCSNPETLEAAAGALQNLAACYWQPSIDIRAAVRKEKGLPILVELLRMEVDRVVCAVATALRNLAIDTRNKELIGKYAMRDLVQKLPAPNQGHDQGTSDDTIAAVLATLNEVIKKSGEFSRSLLEAGGVERLLNLTKQRHRHTARVLKFAGQVLMTMWSHAELREVYRKHGWREADFLTPARAAQPRASSNTSGQGSAGAPHSPSNANSTLSRPMASTGGTRYEDRTIRRHRENDDIPAMDNNYQDGLGMGNPNGRPMNLQGVQAQMPPPSSR